MDPGRQEWTPYRAGDRWGATPRHRHTRSKYKTKWQPSSGFLGRGRGSSLDPTTQPYTTENSLSSTFFIFFVMIDRVTFENKVPENFGKSN